MAIYFDLMDLDQKERERKQRALQEAARIGLNAYLGTREQNRADALANLKMGQDTNNKELIRRTIEERGGIWSPGSVGYDNEQMPVQMQTERPQLYEQMQSAYEQKFTPPEYRTVRAELPEMNKPGALPRTTMPKMQTTREAMVVRESMPEMNSVELAKPKQAAERTGLPVKEILTVRNTVNRSGIRGADGSEYVANFEDALSTMANPRATREEKLLALGRFDAQDKMISEFYGDNQASQYMRGILQGYLGGGGGGGKYTYRAVKGDNTKLITNAEVDKFQKSGWHVTREPETGIVPDTMEAKKLIDDFYALSPEEQSTWVQNKRNQILMNQAGLKAMDSNGKIVSWLPESLNNALVQLRGGRKLKLVSSEQEQKKKSYSGLWR